MKLRLVGTKHIALFFACLLALGCNKGARSDEALNASSRPISVIAGYDLPTAPASVVPGESISATFQAPAGHSTTDWIGLFPVGAGPGGYETYAVVPAGASGSVSLVVPASARGPHELRYYPNNGYELAATSPSFEVINSAPLYALTGVPATAEPGSTVTASFAAPANHSTTDWIGLFPVGAGPGGYETYAVVPAGASGSVSLVVPASARGPHELRYYPNNGYQLAATSTSFEVLNSAPLYALTGVPATAEPGSTITATFVAPANHSTTDWIGLFAVGAGPGGYETYAVVPAGASGSVSLVVPASARGPHDLRYYPNNGYQLAATSPSFEVLNSAPLYALTDVPATAEPGSTITASFAAPADHSTTDWIGLFPVGAGAGGYVTYTRVPAGASGGVSLVVPASARGPHELRYYPNNGYQLAATSASFEVLNSAPLYALTDVPATVEPGSTITASFAAPANHSTTDWVGLFPVGAGAGGYETYTTVPAGANGTVSMVVPNGASGPHELRYYPNNGYVLAATSASFVVSTACPSGYVYVDGAGCQDIDECLTNNGGCHPLTLCSNLPGSRTCGPCPTGYTGTGETTCVDINECATGNGGCHPLTLCSNLPGGRACGPCPTGYTGTGETTCVDINECATGNGCCDPRSACTNTPGGRTCGPCPSGYTGTGDTACMLPLVADELVGRPTDQSITVNVMAGQALEAYFEYGITPGVYTGSTAPAAFADGIIETVVGGLGPDTRYYYRMRYRPSGSTAPYLARSEHTFHTQRPRADTFTFAVQSDSHQGYAGFYNDTLYGLTMANISAAQPDFLVDLGDTVSTDDTTETQATVRQKYLNQRKVFGLAAHSMPVFLALGNHENEEGWNLDDMGADRGNSLPVLGANARKRYFLNPLPGGFYSGNTDASVTEIDGDHLKEDYYAFEWGSALFVVIDPFWYTMKKPFDGAMGGEKTDDVGTKNRWDWTLGDQQYFWLKQTLETSTAKFKFVFAHHATGGTDDYIRAGARGAKYCEWGGYDPTTNNWAFESHRPGWAMPIHQLFVGNGVTAFFHGHDHVFAKELLDGIVYQELPHAANADYGGGFSDNPTQYAGGVLINNSGHLRVTVAPTNVTVDYVRSYLSGGGPNGEVAYSYQILACEVRDSDGDGTNDCTDACPYDPLKTAAGVCGCGQAESSPCPTFTVVRVGSGTGALTTASTAAFLEERSLNDGALVSTTPLPTAVSGANKPLTLGGSNYTEGTLKRTANGRYVTLAGYAAVPGTANIAQTASSSTNRVVARIASNHTIDTTTTINSGFNAGNARAAASQDGTAFWVTGTGTSNSGGIWYATLGASSATQIIGHSGNNPGDVRTAGVFNGQLYGATVATGYYGVFTVATALPTARSSAAILPGFPTSGSSSPVDFAVLDRNPALTGLDTVYVGDDRAIGSGGGIQKWTFNGSTWTLAYTLAANLSTGIRHLLAVDGPGSVILLATTTSSPNQIVKIVDSGIGSGAATLVTAGTNTAFRGLALSPVP